ncbi:MAG: M23 family metallopeptidase [Anaerolineaceae bacterium]|nr:M23 family metallopeptidase [Anaerolineaceae bacterium]
MKQLLDFLLGLIRGLLGLPSEKEQSSATDSGAEDVPCGLGLHEMPETVDTSAVPFVGIAAAAASSEISNGTATADDCTVTVRPELGVVNIRTGPRLGFFPAGKTRGGAVFGLTGASEPDESGFRWFQISFEGGSGWIRSDLVRLSEACKLFTYITDADYPDEPVTPTPPTTTRFARPATAPISNGYSSTRHPGIDLATAMGTPIAASAQGTIIRAIRCTACTDAKPNRFPCGPTTYNDEKWGFGYGNFVIVRHDYAVLPAPVREAMDDANLTGGFAYVLYAHFQELRVDLGDIVQAGTLLGLTGNHGCSTGPHIHIEIRIGNVEIVDGQWLAQKSINPNLFYVL